MSGFFSGVTDEQLAEVDLLAELDGAALSRLKQCSHFIGAHPGLHIIRQGDTGFELYLILSGEADVVREGQVVATLGKGDIFGEMALLGNYHRNADVVARTVMSLLSMTGSEFRRLAADHPEFERRLRDVAESRSG